MISRTAFAFIVIASCFVLSHGAFADEETASPPGEGDEGSGYIGVVLPDEETSEGKDTVRPVEPDASGEPSKPAQEDEKAAEGEDRRLEVEVERTTFEEIWRFATVTISPQVGYLFFQKSEMGVGGLKATVETRNGFITKLDLGLGGDEVGFDISPLYALEFGGIQAGASDLSTFDLSEGGFGASYQAVGGQIAILYRFSIKRFFPHIGAGFHGTYLFGDQITEGTEIYGRFPLGFTIYLGKHVAFVMDLGFMYGATGIRTPPRLPEALDAMPPELRDGLENAKTRQDFERWYSENQAEIDQWMIDNQEELPEDYSRDKMASDFASEQIGKSIRFGSGFGLDITIGLRFP
jgi:hypothetical protein